MRAPSRKWLGHVWKWGSILAVPLTSTIGRYRLVAELGSGGMATVYLAVMLARNGFSKLVVLKVPRPHVSEDPELLAMFLDEARLAARLSHPNVVHTYEVTEDSGRDVIVMEYLEGQTLGEILSKGRKLQRPLPLGLYFRIVIEALQGLHYAHELTDYNGEPLGLVHRDVSPQNIFVTFGGQVKVLDFGIAKATTSSHITQAGTIKGKLRYMPPEQFVGGDIDRRADIFSVGAILWEAVTGQKLWKGAPDSDVISSILRGRIPAPRERKPDLDERLNAIVCKALAFDREHRYSTCLELQDDLESFLKSTSTRATKTDLVAFVSELFEETRRERHRLIDEQVRRATVETSGEYRVLGASELPGEGPLSQSLVSPREPAIPVGSPVNDVEKSVSTKLLRSNPRSRALIVVGLAVTIVALVTFVVVRALSSKTEETATSESPATSLAVTASNDPSAGQLAAEVSVTFTATPREAVIFLDDEPLASNPHKANVPRDGSRHTVRVQAKGYVSQTLGVVYDGEKEVSVTLEHAERAPTPRPAQPAYVPPKPRVYVPPKPSTPTNTATPTPVTPSSPSVAPSDPRPRRPDVRIDEKL